MTNNSKIGEIENISFRTKLVTILSDFEHMSHTKYLWPPLHLNELKISLHPNEHMYVQCECIMYI